MYTYICIYLVKFDTMSTPSFALALSKHKLIALFHLQQSRHLGEAERLSLKAVAMEFNAAPCVLS
jgi:hypothetical protein